MIACMCWLLKMIASPATRTRECERVPFTRRSSGRHTRVTNVSNRRPSYHRHLRADDEDLEDGGVVIEELLHDHRRLKVLAHVLLVEHDAHVMRVVRATRDHLLAHYREVIIPVILHHQHQPSSISHQRAPYLQGIGSSSGAASTRRPSRSASRIAGTVLAPPLGRSRQRASTLAHGRSPAAVPSDCRRAPSPIPSRAHAAQTPTPRVSVTHTRASAAHERTNEPRSWQ